MASERSDIAARRLRAQHLVGPPLNSPAEVVRWMGAVQSQDYGGAKWALAMRSAPVTEAVVDQLFDAGDILRTHVMRPTWHFVAPEDIRWLLDLTGPRVLAGMPGRHRQLGIDSKQIARANAAFANALVGGRHLTRPELGTVLEKARISPEGQRLPHFLLAGELHGLIVSGPRRGKQFTWALLEERAPTARRISQEEAIAELTIRYFRSHGPAQLQDFVWWSGLTMAQARSGLAAAGKAAERVTIGGKDYFSVPALAPSGGGQTATVAHLLPNFDEYLVAYRDRGAALRPDRPFDPALFAFSSILSNVLTIGGRVHGGWRRSDDGKTVRIEVKLRGPLSAAERRATKAECERLAVFLGRPVAISFLS